MRRDPIRAVTRGVGGDRRVSGCSASSSAASSASAIPASFIGPGITLARIIARDRRSAAARRR